MNGGHHDKFIEKEYFAADESRPLRASNTGVKLYIENTDRY
jgi:hypothetical protein